MLDLPRTPARGLRRAPRRRGGGHRADDVDERGPRPRARGARPRPAGRGPDAPDEHPGLLGPLLTLRERRGVQVRAVPFAELAEAVGPRTRLVACSHVSWVTGALAPAELAALPEDVPVLFDGAQGAGAVPVDVEALGCAFYAGAGQKWLCGPVGTGMLWVAPAWRDRLAALGATYLNLDEPGAGLDAGRARRRPPPRRLRHPGRGERARRRRPRRPRRRRVGRRPRPCRRRWPPRSRGRWPSAGAPSRRRDATTLVAWEEADPTAAVARLTRGRGHAARAARHAVPARLGRRVERRGRPRPAARRAGLTGACGTRSRARRTEPARQRGRRELMS